MLSTLIAQAPDWLPNAGPKDAPGLRGAGTGHSQLDLGTIEPPVEAFSVGSDTTTGALSNLELIVSNLIGFLTTLAGLFFVIYFLIGAFAWVTSGGDSGKVGKARDRMLHGVLGMIIVIATYAIVGLIGTIIGIKILEPGEQINLLYQSIL